MTLRPSNLPKLAICACFEPNPDASPAAARGTKLDGIFRRRVLGDQSDDSAIEKDELDAVDWAVNALRAIAGTSEIITAEDRCKIECLGLTGTADAWLPELGMSADLKSGQLRNYREQMAAYALGFGACQRHQKIAFGARALSVGARATRSVRIRCHGDGQINLTRSWWRI